MQLRAKFRVRRDLSSPSHSGKSVTRLLDTSRCWMLRRPRICSVRLVILFPARLSHSSESMEGTVMGIGDPSIAFKDLPKWAAGVGGGGEGGVTTRAPSWRGAM